MTQIQQTEELLGPLELSTQLPAMRGALPFSDCTKFTYSIGYSSCQLKYNATETRWSCMSHPSHNTTRRNGAASAPNLNLDRRPGVGGVAVPYEDSLHLDYVIWGVV
jgi:hypothetical protein